jgi:hypothetical protein
VGISHRLPDGTRGVGGIDRNDNSTVDCASPPGKLAGGPQRLPRIMINAPTALVIGKGRTVKIACRACLRETRRLII